MFSNKRLAFLAFSFVAVVAHAETPRLTLDDIDQLSRDRVVRELQGKPAGTGGAAPGPSTMTTPQSAIVAGGPAKSLAPRPQKVDTRARSEPVTFVGAFSDASGSNVLYEFNGAVYPAHVGTKLLNGWTARKVDGYFVTVADGKRVWSEPIRGGAGAQPPASGSLQAINDLGNPLPPGVSGGTQGFFLGK
ncbi:hypothetical protein [Paraburkholderia gardini]|uniref:hypothetical protein n=1 Tax=Paraburkholderia gardini TaxID=2823469 RepID=UPI001D1B1FC2|nr:hypothetical protein [Paraburkholderia gardini]CAG4914273.1 hypothetical protein R69919_04186 [Paraburkholderia gardini]